MNSLYQQLNPPLPNNNSNFKNFISAFKNNSNPQQFLLNYIKNNPQAQNIYKLLQNSNKSPKELFYELASQKGINPDDILNMLK